MSATPREAFTPAAGRAAGMSANYTVRYRKRGTLSHPPADWDFPRKTIVVTGSPRSGTNYVCSLIGNTGVLGRPAEYFSRDVALTYDPARGCDIAVQVTFPNTLGRTGNGIASFKLFPYNLDAIARDVNLFEFYPDPVFVHVRRRDLLGQSISFARALQTGQWVSSNARQFEPEFSVEAIHDAMMTLTVDEARWRAYFARNAISPLEIVYEELLGQENAMLREIARRAGVDETDDRLVAASSTLKVQRDGLNAEWRERFLRLSGDPNLIEIPERRESRWGRLRAALRGLFRPG